MPGGVLGFEVVELTAGVGDEGRDEAIVSPLEVDSDRQALAAVLVQVLH